MSSFGQNLKKYRKDLKLSQSSLAKLLGVGQTTIANYEKDLRFPSQEILIKLSEVLSVSVDGLLNKASTDTLIKQPITSAESFIDLIIKHKKDEAIKRIMHQVKDGDDVLNFYYGLLTEALHLVGIMWQRGEISIPMEHYISHVTDEILFSLRPMIDKAEKKKKKVLLMVPGFEKHLLGLKIVKESFLKMGWDTFYIGESVPWTSLVESIEKDKVDLVCISVTLGGYFNDLKALIDFIRSQTKVKILLGGQAFKEYPNYIDQIKPDFYAQSKEDLESINRSFND